MRDDAKVADVARDLETMWAIGFESQAEGLENRYAAIESEMRERRPNQKLQGEEQDKKCEIEAA
jgi:hypothetical protein